MKVSGVWRYVYRVVDQHGQVIDVFVSKHRDIPSARRFFTTSLMAHRSPVEVITDRAPALANVIDELIPAASQHRAVRDQPVRGRSRPSQSQAEAGARAEDRPNGQRRDPRPRVRPEPAARPLRTRNRRRAGVPVGDRIRRTPARNLNDSVSVDDPTRPTIAKRNSAHCTACGVLQARTDAGQPVRPQGRLLRLLDRGSLSPVGHDGRRDQRTVGDRECRDEPDHRE